MNPLTAALQHLLNQNPWALAKLAPYAGEIFALRLPPLALHFAIQADGNVTSVNATEVGVAATLEISPAVFLRYMGSTARDPELLVVSGDAELGAVLREIFSQLNWEAEEDLSRLLGDVLAHRVVGAARGFAHWGKQSAEQLTAAFAEYVSEERPVLVKASDVARFSADLEALQVALSQLEQRISNLRSP